MYILWDPLIPQLVLNVPLPVFVFHLFSWPLLKSSILWTARVCVFVNTNLLWFAMGLEPGHHTCNMRVNCELYNCCFVKKEEFILWLRDKRWSWKIISQSRATVRYVLFFHYGFSSPLGHDWCWSLIRLSLGEGGVTLSINCQFTTGPYRKTNSYIDSC